MRLFHRLIFVVPIVLGMATSAQAVVRNWTGVVNTYWSEPGNWNPNGAPQTGDRLGFLDVPVRFDSQNDLTNLHLQGIGMAQGGYNLSGNTVFLDSDFTDAHSGTVSNRISLSVYFTGPGSFNVLGSQTGPLVDMFGQVRMPSTNTLLFNIAATDGNGQPGYLTLHDAIVSSGPVVKVGNGALYVRNSNPNVGSAGMYFLQGFVYLFGLQMSVPDGDLVIGSAGGSPTRVYVGASQWSVRVNLEMTNAELFLNYNAQLGHLIMHDGATIDGPGSIDLYYGIEATSDSVTPAISVPFALHSSQNNFNIHGANYAGLDVQGSIGGSGSIQKLGSSALLLESSNSFAGNVLVEDGILEVHDAYGLGADTNNAIIRSNATLRLAFSGTMPQPLFLTGAGVGGIGALEVVAGNSLSLTSVTLDNPSTLGVGSGGGLTINNSILGTGPLTKIGQGFLQFSGAGNNAYSGDTIVLAGNLNLAKDPNVVAVPHDLVVGPAAALSPATARIYQNGGLGGTTVTVNANSLFDLNGYNVILTQLTLNDGGNVNTRAGTLSLADGASVSVGSLSAFGSHAASTISGNLLLPVGIASFNVSPHASTPPLVFGPELDIPAAISGGSTAQITAVDKYGLGQLQLDGNNPHSSRIRVYEGTLIAANGGALGDSSAGTYVYNGASLALDTGIILPSENLVLDSTNAAALDNRSGNNVWGGGIYLNRDSSIHVGGNDSLIATGVIDGPGSLIKAGTGNLILSGTGYNTYAGETFVNQGTLFMDKPLAVTAVPGALEIGAIDGSSAGTVRNLNSYQVVGNIYVHTLGLLDVNGQTENVDALSLYGNGAVQTGAGYLNLKVGGAIYVYPGANTTATINGNVAMDAGNHLITVASGANLPGVNDLVISAAISQTSPAASIQKEGAGRMRLTAANTYTGSTTVNAGTLQVDGTQPQSPVTITAGTLAGSGTVGHVYMNGASGAVAPGASPGILTCSNLNFGILHSGTLQVELNGTAPGSGYDQVNVRGTVNLSGISLHASLGYSSSVNDQFTIIANDGTDAVIGTFTGLPQNKRLYIGQELFQISYTGGSGNDVVLSRLTTPPPPTLTIDWVPPSAVRLLWATNDPPFTLQTATDLPATNWTAALPLPVVIGTNNIVTNAVSDPQRLFRLSPP